MMTPGIQGQEIAEMPHMHPVSRCSTLNSSIWKPSMNRLTTNSISGWLAGNGNWKRKYEEEDMEGDMEGKKDE